MDLTNQFHIVIQKLQSLSSIKSGQYWNTSDQRPQAPGLLTSLWRTLYIFESREFNLEDIKTSIESAFDLIDDLYNSENYDLATELQTELLHCRYGILNLKTIYHDSIPTKQEIDRIVSSIKSKFIKMNETYNGLYPMINYISPNKPVQFVRSDPIKINHNETLQDISDIEFNSL